jgi:hypothetical protein
VYYPYFRGKQFELIALRESAPLISEAGFVPVIEPVRESLGGLERTLEALDEAGARSIVIVNPLHGDHRENGEGIAALLDENYLESDAISPGVLLRSQMTPEEAEERVGTQAGRQNRAVIHAGFTEARLIAEALGDDMGDVRNLFIDDQTNMLYRRRFSESIRVLVKDGFERKRNADYGEVDNFSDLHVTFRDMGMDGYGDFLTVGDNYSEGGGPAYAVAIHLTYIDEDQDQAMLIYHFVSDSNDTPTDPAGKFAQALAKLIARLNSGDSKLLESSAVAEFRQLHERGHFPGLGHVKKLSIKHHLETLADFHRREADVA